VFRLLQLKLGETLRAVAPLVGVVCVLQALMVGAPVALFLQFLAGAALAVLGMLLLFAGIDIGVLPMGRYLGADLPRHGSVWLILGVGFAMGFATTVAEPDVLVLARQVALISPDGVGGQTLVYITASGVGLFTSIALLRVLRGTPMTRLLTVTYVAMLVLSLLAPAEYVALAYDAGSVTTGVLTAPVVLALSLGLTSVLAGRSAVSDGFGLLGLASAGPILAILAVGTFLR
jgi:hypothetical protein